MMPSDNLTMNIGLTTEDWRWGKTSQGAFVTRPTTTQSDDGVVNFEVRYAYMDINTAYGMFKVGRMPGSASGLATVGWTGTWLGSVFLDDTASSSRDRIAYILPMGNFQMIAVYEKKQELDDSTGNQGDRTANKYDQDWDEWSITPVYKFSNGGVACTFSYDKINSQFYTLESSDTVTQLLPVPVQMVTAGLGGTSDIDGYYWTINPGASVDFGPVANWRMPRVKPSGTTRRELLPPGRTRPRVSPMTSTTKSTCRPGRSMPM